MTDKMKSVQFSRDPPSTSRNVYRPASTTWIRRMIKLFEEEMLILDVCLIKLPPLNQLAFDNDVSSVLLLLLDDGGCLATRSTLAYRHTVICFGFPHSKISSKANLFYLPYRYNIIVPITCFKNFDKNIIISKMVFFSSLYAKFFL